MLVKNATGGQKEFIFSRWVTAGGGWSPGILHAPVGEGVLNQCLSPSLHPSPKLLQTLDSVHAAHFLFGNTVDLESRNFSVQEKKRQKVPETLGGDDSAGGPAAPLNTCEFSNIIHILPEISLKSYLAELLYNVSQ